MLWHVIDVIVSAWNASKTWHMDIYRYGHWSCPWFMVR